MKPATKVIQKPSFVNEPVFVTKDGVTEPYIAKSVTSGRDMYAASLHLLFKHVADFHSSILDILSEKYSIPVEEMLNTIHEDPRFTEMVVNPVIHTMGYFDGEEKKEIQKEPVKEEAPEVPEVTQIPEVPKAPVKRKVVRLKKTTTS
jgi:hypothetical protein